MNGRDAEIFRKAVATQAGTGRAGLPPWAGGRRKQGGLIAKMLFFFAVMFAAGSLLWMLFLPAVVTRRIEERTGFAVALGSMFCNPFAGVVQVSSLQIRNPEGFPQPEFVEMPRFSTDLSVPSLFTERLVVARLVVNLSELALVRDRAGNTNLDLFRSGLLAEPTPEPRPEPRPFLIRELALRIDRIIVADHSGPVPRVRVIDVNINRTFENVTDAREILGPLAADLAASGLTQIAGSILGLFVPAPIRDAFEIYAPSPGLLEGAPGALKNVFEALEERLKR